MNDKRSFYILPTDKAVELVKITTEATEKRLIDLQNGLGTESYEKLLNILSDTNKILSEMKAGNVR